MFEKLNKSRTIQEGISTENMEFRPLKEFCGQEIKVNGFFFTDSKYGRQTVVVGNGYLINMPKRAVEDFEAVQNDKEMLKGMLDGHMMLHNMKMVDTKNGTTVHYEFKDC